MSDNYKIKYSSKDQFYVMVLNKISDWYTQLDLVEKKLMAISNMDSFQGESADSVKAYINEVYAMLLISTRQTLLDFLSRVTLYTEGFYNFETNLYAVLPQETMHNVINTSENERIFLMGEKQKIANVLVKISDLIDLSNPSQENLNDALQDIEGKTQTLDTKIIDYEDTNKTAVDTSLAPLISSLRAAINTYLRMSDITGYQSGDYAKKTEILDLYNKVTKSMEYTNTTMDKVSEASENMQEVFVQQQKDYEEACKAREDEGWANIIGGGLAVIGSVAAIVLTAGAATPIVVTVAVTGTCGMAYGVSNMAEGAQDVYYGQNGDLSSAAWNPIRDTVFNGNQDLYDAWGSINLTIASLCVPAHAAVNSVAGQSSNVILKTVGKKVAGAWAKDTLVEKFSEDITKNVAEDFGLNKTQTVIAGAIIEGGVDKGVDKVSDAYVKHTDGALDSDFTDRMSYEDAKRYNEFMNRTKVEAPSSVDYKNNIDADISDFDAKFNNVDTKFSDLNPGTADVEPVKIDTDIPKSDNIADANLFDGDSSTTHVVVDKVDVDTTITDNTADTNISDSDVTNEYDNVDWENTSNTPEEQAIIREMEENGEFIRESVNKKGEVIYEDYGPIESTPSAEPTAPAQRMPTENQGTIIGDRESGNFEFIPDDPETQRIMKEYGQDTIKIKDKEADFSPFDTHDTPWGTHECEVQIGHMTGERTGTVDNPGNFKQADAELAKQISEATGETVTESQIRKYREDNGLTWHETGDCTTMQLVPTEINQNCAHTGGTAESKYHQAWGDVSKDFE